MRRVHTVWARGAAGELSPAGNPGGVDLRWVSRALHMPEPAIDVAVAPDRPGAERRRGIAPAVVSLKIIATAIVFVFLYYASSIVISLIFALFLAFVLDPGVKVMERIYIPRWLGSLVMLLITLAVIYALVYLIYDRSVAFVADLPRYVEKLRQIMEHLQSKWAPLRRSAATLARTTADTHVPAVRIQESEPWVQYLLRGIGSVYGVVVSVMFIPFLVFFMLTSKDHVLRATVNVFRSDRQEMAQRVMSGISRMVRQYVLGNILVGLISTVPITVVFEILHLHYALLMGPLAAFLSLVPYLGVGLGVLPPLLIALVQFNTWEPFAAIAVTVVVVHFVALNILTPKFVGGRVKLNTLTVTIAMMFWGWLWGGVGLVLAIPITAAVKAVCDNVPSLKPYGAWMEGG